MADDKIEPTPEQRTAAVLWYANDKTSALNYPNTAAWIETGERPANSVGFSVGDEIVDLAYLFAKREHKLRLEAEQAGKLVRAVQVSLKRALQLKEAACEQRDEALAQVAQLKALIVDGRKAVLAWVKDPWLDGRRQLGLDFLAASAPYAVDQKAKKTDHSLHFNDGQVTLHGKVIGGMWINPNHPFTDNGSGTCKLCVFSREQCANYPGRTAPCICKLQPQEHDDYCPLRSNPG